MRTSIPTGGVARAVLCGALLLASASALAEPHRALWRSQQLEFVYRGRMTLYDCRSLERKVGQIIALLGAHPMTRIELVSCRSSAAGGTPHQFAAMQIRLVSPAPATPVLRAEIERDASRVALLDRLGVARPSRDEFPARWLAFDVARIRALKLGSGDCELLRQLGEQVLPHLALQSFTYRRTCSSSRRRPVLKVVALLPAHVIDSVGQVTHGDAR